MDALEPEADLVLSCNQCLDKFPRRPILQFVKSHQDEEVPYEDLSLFGQLNYEADAMATMQLEMDQSAIHRVPFDPVTGAQITIDGHFTVTRKLSKTLRASLSRFSLEEYYHERLHWTPMMMKLVDWALFGLVYNKFTRCRVFINRMCFRQLPVGDRNN